MNDSNILKIYAEETVDVLEVLREEIEMFFECPQDRHLMQLIDADLSDIESKSNMLGVMKIGMATHRLHHHLESLLSKSLMMDAEELGEILREIDNVETELNHYRMAG
jgi:chemotaxis protein histidine kinase CheA